MSRNTGIRRIKASSRILDLFKAESNVLLNHRVVKIDPKARELHFAHGFVVRYGHLISSVPLPELIPMVAGAPKDVIEASQNLACTNLVL